MSKVGESSGRTVVTPSSAGAGKKSTGAKSASSADSAQSFNAHQSAQEAAKKVAGGADTFERAPSASPFVPTNRARSFHRSGGYREGECCLRSASGRPRPQSKMSQHFWAHLPKRQRENVAGIYNRMTGHGIWDQVKSVSGEKGKPEPHARVLGMEFEVSGNSGGIAFEAHDAKALIGKMKDTGFFGEDNKWIAMMHPGQRSLREGAPANRTSLHVSVGPGNQFDAHIDKVAPTRTPGDGNTRLDPINALRHHSNEVWPELIRDFLGIPGLLVHGSIKPGSAGKMPEVKVGVRLELRGPVGKEGADPTFARTSAPEGLPAPKGVMKKIADRIEASGLAFPVPKGLKAGEAPSARQVAETLAAKIMEAGLKGESRIQLDLPQYAHLKSQQDAALGTVRRLGAIVHSEMTAARAAMPEDQLSEIPALDNVRNATVSFGVRNDQGMPTQGGTVQLPVD